VGRIGWKSGKGRCVLATRDITALELILFDAAIGKKGRFYRKMILKGKAPCRL
jgi:hypothetical protein